jgi:BolA protein
MRMETASDKELTSSDFGASAAPTRAARMHALLTGHLAPSTLKIDDDSARHSGHAGAAPGGETHFNLVIVSARFQGLSRVARQRAVMDALKPEFETGLHALSITARTPEEA